MTSSAGRVVAVVPPGMTEPKVNRPVLACCIDTGKQSNRSERWVPR